MLNFNYLERGLGIASPPHFMYGFKKSFDNQKEISYVILYKLIKFYCLIVFTQL